MIFINNSNNSYNVFLKTATCDYCSKNSLVVYRKYSGELICTSCFTKRIEKNISQTISKYKMLKPKDKIVVGISGGKDSLSLLYNLNLIQANNYRSNPIIAVTIDEGIRDYRDISIKNATEFCELHKIEHKIISFKEKTGKTLDEIVELNKSATKNIYACNFCATLRRRILNETAKNLGANVLAMGHNLTDIAETYLMNILFKRFKLIAKQYLFKRESKEIKNFFVRRITPLMKLPEEEIFLYANLKRINYYPSHCPYREEDPILRKRVLEFIQECKKFSPEIEFNLLNGFLEMSEIFSKHYIPKAYKSCKICGYPCGNTNVCLYCKYTSKFEN